MTDRNFVLDFALSLPATRTDCPFENDFFTKVLRHDKTGKWFGILLNAPRRSIGLSGEGYVEVLNLKCDPAVAELMRENYPAVKRAYHMNKEHWISVVFELGLPEPEAEKLIKLSFELTGGKFI